MNRHRELQCVFCESAAENPVELGEMLTFEHINAHHFCLLLSSNLVQEGEDDEGMLGFLQEDIEMELARAQTMKCCYCKQRGANIGCCDKKCKKAFHLPCAIAKDCLFEFHNTFRSFCHAHHGIKRPGSVHGAEDDCIICGDQLGEYAPVRSINTPCCSKWLHKLCLMRTARSFGYFFRCPLCNNEDTFRENMKLRGIFIPDKDGSWEEEPDAFAELRERPSHCSAAKCLCSQGREYNARKEKAKFSLIFCQLCGSCGIHIKCNGSPVFECKDCVAPVQTVDTYDDEYDIGSHGRSHGAQRELSSENVRCNSHGSDNNHSHLISSTSVELVDIFRAERPKSKRIEGHTEVLVHTQASGSSSASSPCSASTSAQATHGGSEPGSGDECIRSIRKNRSLQICSDSDDSNDGSVVTLTASETRMQIIGLFGKPVNGGEIDSDDEDEIKPVILSPRKRRTRMSSSGLSASSMENAIRWAPKRNRHTAFSDTSSDDESLIENQDAIKPMRRRSKPNIENRDAKPPLRRKLKVNNNNNASTPLLEDNKNKWNRRNVEIDRM